MTPSYPTGTPSEIRVGWRVLLACFLGMVFAEGTVMTYTSGVFAVAIGKDLGWSRLDLAWPMTFFYYALVPGALACGLLIDRYGTRRLILVSTGMFALALVGLAALPPSHLVFAVAFALLAMCAMGTLPVSYARVIVGRFERQRGLALGIALTGVGAGAAVLPMLSQALIDMFGWRIAYLAIAAMVGGISLPFAWAFIRETDAAAVRAGPDTDFRGAFSDSPIVLMLLGGISLLSGAVLTALVVHLVPILRDRGVDAAAAARLAGVMGLSVIVGRITIGVLMDRFQASVVLALFLVGPAMGAGLLAIGSGTASLPLAAALIGLAQGAEVDAVAFLVSRHFDRRHFGVLYGTMFSSFTMGAANGPLALAKASSGGGGYGEILLVVAGLACLTAIMAIMLPRYGRRGAHRQPAS